MKRRLTVLNVAYPLAPVGPDAVGGAEQVLTALDHALVAAGHNSVVIACEGSATAGVLIEVPGCSQEITEDVQRRIQDAVQHAIANVSRTFPVDVIHLHGIDFSTYLPPPGVPVLATLHLPPSWYPDEALRPARPDTWLVCVSQSQHNACPADAHLLAPIANGVPVDSLARTTHGPRDFALSLGRICPEKGQHLALQAAHAAGISLLVCGKTFAYPSHAAYFERQVAPLLDGRRRYLGPVGFARKRRLLSAARCLLVPSLAPETSSLVAMEALACGTPVIAFPAGALSEIVEDGVTGFLVRHVEEMAAAIRRAGEIDPTTCRSVARARFDRSRMTADYLCLYARLAGAGTVPVCA